MISISPTIKVIGDVFEVVAKASTAITSKIWLNFSKPENSQYAALI